MKQPPTKAKVPAKTGRARQAKPSPSTKPAAKRSSKVGAGKASRLRGTAAGTMSTSATRASGRAGSSPGDLLRAGLNALSRPRAESAVADGLSRIADSFGLKKLEDVFDHRVVAALERIGYPSAEDMNKLIDQVAELVKLLRSQKTRP